MHFPALTPKRLTILAAAVVCAAALIPAAALAATSSSPARPATAARANAGAPSTDAISINSATLVANGAAIRLTFTATCGAGDNGSVGANVIQATGRRVAQGGGGSGFKCTGKPQKVSALAVVNVNGAVFHTGIALVQASVANCPGANCTITIGAHRSARSQRHLTISDHGL